MADFLNDGLILQQKYHEGQAADCRKYVQQLNMKKGELEKNKDRSGANLWRMLE